MKSTEGIRGGRAGQIKLEGIHTKDFDDQMMIMMTMILIMVEVVTVGGGGDVEEDGEERRATQIKLEEVYSRIS